jgi:hypothetical protein
MADHTSDIHAAVTLTTLAQSITTGITQPNVPRVLSITGTKAGATLTGNVTITGTDENDEATSDVLALNGNYTVFGTQVFKTVTQIDYPARVTASDTVKVGVQDGLFDIPTLRSFDKDQITAAAYPDADLLAKEIEIREFFAKTCGVDFLPTSHTDYLDGDGTRLMLLSWPRVLSVTAAATRSSTTWTSLTAGELAQLQPQSSELYWEDSAWPHGIRNVRVTYVAGHHSVPTVVKRAALMIAVTELPATNVPFSADRYDADGMAVTFAQGDGYNGNWSRIADVRKAIRMYDESLPGIA